MVVVVVVFVAVVVVVAVLVVVIVVVEFPVVRSLQTNTAPKTQTLNSNALYRPSIGNHEALSDKTGRPEPQSLKARNSEKIRGFQVWGLKATSLFDSLSEPLKP